jgi:sulfur-oxidizing protein SoxY
MNRRNFLGLSLGVAAVSMIPASLSAEDFRASKPKVWTATKVDEAMTAMFGTTKTVEGGINLSAPEIAENGAVIPISFDTNLNAKTIAVFQDANPEATVAVFTLNGKTVADYAIRIKMQKTGKVTVVADVDGVLHAVTKEVKVTIGGCGG